MTHSDTIDLTDAIEPDDDIEFPDFVALPYDIVPENDIATVTTAEVIDRIQAALKYSQELYRSGCNPEYWRGRIDAFSYMLTELSGMNS